MSINKTFDKYRIQNSKQDTGLIDINTDPWTDGLYENNARRVKNEWFINRIRDVSNIPNGIPTNMEWAYKKRLEDHYNVVTLVKDNSSNEEIHLFYSDIIYKKSIR